MPVLVAAPFFLIWVGFGPPGQWLLVAFLGFVAVAVAALVAATAMPPRYEKYAATLGVPLRRRLRHLVLPYVGPPITSALRVALGAAWGLQTTAELMGSPAGVGRIISVRAQPGDVSSVLAVLLIVGLVALVLDTALGAFTQRLSRWQTA